MNCWKLDVNIRLPDILLFENIHLPVWIWKFRNWNAPKDAENRKLYIFYGGPKVSRQFQCYSRQFQFVHGNLNLLTAISIYSRQRSRHFSLRSPPVSYGGRQWPCTKSQNAKSKVDIQSRSSKRKARVKNRKSIYELARRTRGYLHETGTNSDRYEFASVSIHFFPCVYWDRPKSELRPVWLHLGRWADRSYFRAGLRPYRFHIKQKPYLRPGP